MSPSIYEIDFRHDWISLTLHALKSGFDGINKMSDEIPWFDGGWEMEHAESVLGIAYIAAQTYILGTVEDMNQIRNRAGKEKLSKISYYSDDHQPLPNGVSRILLINSLANYYKHHDEWEKWPDNPTTQTLSTIGVFEGSEFPCYHATTILWGEDDLENLENLLSIISEWRKYILSKYI